MPPALAEFLYATLLRVATPAYLARLWWRGRAEPLYRAHWDERLGGGHPNPGTGRLWIHAVSLGETRAAAALVQALRVQRPELCLLLTHGTATGREAGRALLRDGDLQAWLPYDTPGAVRRFLRTHRPLAGVLLETEVWPGLLKEAQRCGVPVVLANARLSEKSLRRGERLATLMRAAAGRLTTVLAQTQADAQRLRRMGAPAVTVSGNLKFDMSPDAEAQARGRGWREASSRPILLAASTREGEEPSLLRAWRAALGGATALQAQGCPRLWIVPRHPQRFDEVAGWIEREGHSLSRRSAWIDGRPGAQDLQADIWLGDTLGEMPAYYAAASVALLGGSFEPLGGQNLIEAAACACPLVMGPSTYNFAQAADAAVAAGAALQVPDLVSGVRTALDLLGHPARRQAMADAGRAFTAASRGAAQAQAAAILAVIDKAHIQ